MLDKVGIMQKRRRELMNLPRGGMRDLGMRDKIGPLNIVHMFYVIV